MKYILSFCVSALIFTILSIPAASQALTKAEAAEWSDKLIDDLTEIYGNGFNPYIKTLTIPEKFDFKELPLVYDKRSNGENNLTQQDYQFLRNVGIVSGVAKVCGLDWDDRNYLPMMKWRRTFLPENEQKGFQISIEGVVHGFAQGGTEHYFETHSPKCDQVIPVLKSKLFADMF